VAVVRILGIDPGTQVVGFGCLELVVDTAPGPARELPLAMRGANVVRVGGGGAGGAHLVGAGVLRLGGRNTELPQRLLSLADQFRGLLQQFAPNELAIEEAFYGKSAQAALRIGEARGVVLAEAARGGAAVFQFPPARVKRCITGNGAAGKESVAAMVRQLVQHGRGALAGDLPLDATDAVAVAWTRLEQRRSPMAQWLADGGLPD
jgi:crossover junction endodeoxyribonuclease RuvC